MIAAGVLAFTAGQAGCDGASIEGVWEVKPF